MINKVENLVSIGKFRNYQATGQVNFKKLTLIFGDNGSGKTTLTSVFRSLTTNNPEIIRNRISTNHTAAQAAQITKVATPTNVFHTFGVNGWSNQLPDIEIFDIHFVNDNIYSGFDFSDEHKKQLHQFVIGAQGVAIQNQIELNKISKTQSRQTQSNIESQLIQQVGNNLTGDLINHFLNIPETRANNIDQQIAMAETSLASANANAVIQTLQPLSTLSEITTGINFASLIADLQTTSQTIQNSVLETLFSQHCQDLSANTLLGPENWLQKGFAYVESKQTANEPLSCPFCKQSIDINFDIINAYTSKFNVAFNALIQRLQTHLQSLQNFNLEAALQTLNNVNQINTDRVTTWSIHLPNTVQQPVFNIIANETDLRTEFQNLIATVEQKIQTPTIPIDPTTTTVFHNSGQTINANIVSYNQSVAVYNTAITEFRSNIQTVATAQHEVDRLNIIKKRFETPIKMLCNQLKTERETLRSLEIAYTRLSQQQEAAATAFFNDYQTRINHYLENVFRTQFRIENVIHVAPQGKGTHSKIAYKLTFDGSDISFSPNQPFNAKECLSEGDKSTIALAFFLSKLDIDPNKQNKILIFDDPLTSLDTNRRTYTIGIIKTLFTELKQVVILSHNEFFLHEIGKDIAASDKSTLRITENFVDKASKIEVCDLDELVKIDYFKHIERLEAFRSNPDINLKDSVLGWLRNVLEAHLRFKFYKDIRSMTGQKTFGRLISFLNVFPVTFRDNAHRTVIISKLNLINGVSWKPHHGDPNPDYTALGINPNTITVTELNNLILDTLNLIEVQI